jgi:hypothetical protein
MFKVKTFSIKHHKMTVVDQPVRAGGAPGPGLVVLQGRKWPGYRVGASHVAEAGGVRGCSRWENRYNWSSYLNS